MAITQCKIEPFYGEINYNYTLLHQLGQQLAGDLHDAFIRPPSHLHSKTVRSLQQNSEGHGAITHNTRRSEHMRWLTCIALALRPGLEKRSCRWAGVSHSMDLRTRCDGVRVNEGSGGEGESTPFEQ